MPTYNGITMTLDDALTFWTRWARKHDKTYPLLARALPRWQEFFPGDDGRKGEPWEEEPRSSGIYWDEDLSLSEPWMAWESWEKAPDVLEAVTDVLNKAAFDRLLEITTSGPESMTVWEELSYEKLWELIRATKDPLQRFALLDGPVETTTQLTWFAAWWIQEFEPPAVPSPAWATSSDYAADYPEPAWIDEERPPLPRWYPEWLHEWMEANYGTDGEDWYDQKAF
jgi:hypothetical protein